MIVGDHKQLPPVIKHESESGKHGEVAGVSLMERLIEHSDETSTFKQHLSMLRIQRRMHSAISRFSNSAFYKGLVKDGTKDDNLKPILQLDQGGNACIGTVEFRHVGKDTLSKEWTDYHEWNKYGNEMRNDDEVRVIVSDLKKMLLSTTFRENRYTIGVISPYQGQKKALQVALEQEGVLGSRAKNLQHDIMVATADGFQG